MLLRALLVFSLGATSVGLLTRPALAGDSGRALKRLPRLFGLRLGQSLASAKALLAKRGANINAEKRTISNTFGKPAKEVRIDFSPKKTDRIVRVQAYFFNGGLARYKVYGPGAKKVVAARLAAPTLRHRHYDYWLNRAKLWGIRCRPHKCEIFDMGVIARRKASTRGRMRAAYDLLMKRLER